MNLSNKNSYKSQIVDRIIELSGTYKTQKKFLTACSITNHSYLSDLKKGKIKNPSADYLAKIVDGTGCSGSWLLTGIGEMFGTYSAANMVRENKASDAILLKQLEEGLNGVLKEGLDNEYIPTGLDLKLAKTLTLILEHQNK